MAGSHQENTSEVHKTPNASRIILKKGIPLDQPDGPLQHASCVSTVREENNTCFFIMVEGLKKGVMSRKSSPGEVVLVAKSKARTW